MNRLQFKIKAFDDATGEFSGIASVYDVVDLYNDSVEKGAFKRTLDHSKGRYPLLWQHKTDEPIGECKAKDEEDGLHVQCKLNLDVQKGREAYALIKQGVVKGLSIGYDVVKDAMDGGVRLLKEIALWEVSVVTFPACPPAQIMAVKAVVPFQDLPVCDEAVEWDEKAAVLRVFEWAKTAGAGKERDAFAKAHLWSDGEKGVKFPIADVIEGRLVVVPKAIYAAGAALMEKSADISNEERIRLKGNLSRYYSKLDRVAPWDETNPMDAALASVIGQAEVSKAKGMKVDTKLVSLAIESLKALATDTHPGTDSGNHSGPGGEKSRPANDDEEAKMLSALLSIMVKKQEDSHGC